MALVVPDFAEYAERFGIRESVVENLYEEYAMEVEAFEVEITFFEYLVEEFAQAAYMIEAIENNGDAVDCLEAYDACYTLFDND